MTRLSCLAAVLIVAVDTLTSAAEPPAKPAQTLTEADNGKTVSVKVDDLVAISLKGNPTTGYRWRTAKVDGKAVEQTGEPKYTTNQHRPGMVGVGGTFLFTFKATKPGKAAVSLEYARSFEKNKKPAKTFAVTIEVEEK